MRDNSPCNLPPAPAGVVPSSGLSPTRVVVYRVRDSTPALAGVERAPNHQSQTHNTERLEEI
jgi:hypothetical protein